MKKFSTSLTFFVLCLAILVVAGPLEQSGIPHGELLIRVTRRISTGKKKFPMTLFFVKQCANGPAALPGYVILFQ